MLGAFTNTLKVGLDLTLELKTVAARATLERFLDDIATELSGANACVSSLAGIIGSSG